MTVELDGVGRQLSELPTGSHPAQEPGPVPEAGPEMSDRPVFVDETGRRGKTFRRAGWIVAIGCASYAVTLAVSMIGGNSTAPWLQIPGLADDRQPETVEIQPAPTVSGSAGESPATPGADPSPTGSNGGTVPRPSGTAGTDASGEPVPTMSLSAKPPADPAGGTGDDTEPDPGTSPGTGGNPGAGTGGTGAEPDPGTSPVDESPPATDPASPPPVDPPPPDGGQPEGSRPMAAGGAF
ncbi:hypothetical protein KQY30_22680 [Streptomyces sp. GMY02]|uniref:hypothetical protein n=1 Tax=Streptomyces sp. GMY02 TaxID=1333528 RepID=UPI001C2C857E|nr:hypothetical protein [Streptomyces sp. GMY02]QXE36609.1 hypothetical protein KQY30_22680 [Streptomyces sp. GMY02]